MTACELARGQESGLRRSRRRPGYDYRAHQKLSSSRNPVTDIERFFSGRAMRRILIAIVNNIEDKRNVLHGHARHGSARVAGGGRQHPLLLVVLAG